MNITVNVDDVDLTSEIGNGYDEEGNPAARTLGEEVARKLANALMRDEEYPGLRRKVMGLREEEIREQLKPIVSAAIEEGVQETNRWGEPTGTPTTLRALIIAEAGKLLKQPADNYSRDKGTWIDALVRDNVQKVIRAELGAVLAEEKAKVVAAVQAKAAELIAQAVKEGVGR
ncbi:hypothetical protein CSH63_17750 [Micromonospora tulbaghiae]|uniref:Uncharacterized protein n=1 Tax=Micromonospora tulbaghiae TaxID=479978 RepID=A0A386WLQ3_9ACTN|nr:hypothetical protein [Micromonospora tulbaghiae]AYF29276.1 hypothetical protein CSH63_17750 [Micromonospora tulbaghiae]